MRRAFSLLLILLLSLAPVAPALAAFCGNAALMPGHDCCPGRPACPAAETTSVLPCCEAGPAHPPAVTQDAQANSSASVAKAALASGSMLRCEALTDASRTLIASLEIPVSQSPPVSLPLRR